MYKKILLILLLLFISSTMIGCSHKTLPKKCGDKKWEGYDWYEKG